MKQLKLSRFTAYLLGLMLVGTLASCMKDEDTNYPQAVLTMVNGYVSTPNVMYVADNNNIHNSYNPLHYKSYDFAYLFPGSRRIRVFSPSNTTLTDDTYTFSDSTYYTSFVFGKGEDVSQLIVEDELIPDLNEQAALRFYHLSPSEGQVSVYLNDVNNPIAENVVYADNESAEQDDNADFVAEESGEHTIIVKDEDGETLLTRDFKFEKGVHYTIILIGDNSSETTPLYIGVVTQYR